MESFQVTAPHVPPLSAAEMAALTAQGASGSNPNGAPQFGPGWAARLFGGGDPLAQGLMTPRDARQQGRQALLTAGLNILANSGPAPYRRSIFEILANGALAGRQAYESGVQGTLAQRQLRQQQAEQQRIAQQRQELAGLIGQNPERLAQIFPQIVAQAANGDENARAMLGPLSNYLNQPTGSEPTQLIPGVGAPGTPNAGKKVIRQVTRDGRVIREDLQPPEDTGTQTRADRTAARESANTWLRYNLDVNDRKATDAYWQAVSHLNQAQRNNPAAYKPVISAFVGSAEPNNRILLGMLTYLSDVDPSIQGRVDILQDRLRSGTWPPQVLANLRNIIEDNFRENSQRYQTAYQAAIQDNPEMEPFLRPYKPDIVNGTRAMGTDTQKSSGSALDRLRGRP